MVFSLLDRSGSGYFSAVHLVPQRGHECVTALFQASHHAERDGNHLERPDSLFHSKERVYSRTLKWKQAVGLLNRHSAALHGKYRCSWCSLRILAARRLMGRRRFGIRSRCALSVASVTRREGSAFMCELTGADQRRLLGIFTNIRPLKARKNPG